MSKNSQKVECQQGNFVSSATQKWIALANHFQPANQSVQKALLTCVVFTFTNNKYFNYVYYIVS